MQEPDQRRLLHAVVEVVRAKILERPLPKIPDDPAFAERAGVFVTLRVAGELRGCIGTLSDTQSVREAAHRMAQSALNDPRFGDRRVQGEELPDLTVELMVLGAPRAIQSPDEIVIGRHGVVAEIGQQSGVFLPQVAVDQGWGVEELLSNLCRLKLQVPSDAWRLPEAKLFVIEGQKVGTAPGEIRPESA